MPAKKVPARKSAPPKAPAAPPTVTVEDDDDQRCRFCDGQVAREVRKLVAELDIDEDRRRTTLAALAVSLAGQIDVGADLRSTAPVARELQALIEALVGDDDDADPDEFEDWEGKLADASS